MYILSTKKLRFDKERDIALSSNPDENSFTTQGGMVFEEAPDWIAQTDFYKLAIDDGSVKDATSAKQRKQAEVDPTVVAPAIPDVNELKNLPPEKTKDSK